MIFNVHISGDKSGFNSKSSVDKFKTSIKSVLEKNEELNVEDLTKRYINTNFTLSVERKDDNIYANVMKRVEQSTKENRELLKAKINLMKKSRTNSDYYKAKSGNVPEDIMEEYTKLKKLSKMPIPEPSEILENPEQYKPMLAMVLGNTMMKQLTLWGFFSSETGMTQTLRHIPVPGRFDGNAPYTKGEKAWAE